MLVIFLTEAVTVVTIEVVLVMVVMVVMVVTGGILSHSMKQVFGISGQNPLLAQVFLWQSQTSPFGQG